MDAENSDFWLEQSQGWMQQAEQMLSDLNRQRLASPKAFFTGRTRTLDRLAKRLESLAAQARDLVRA